MDYAKIAVEIAMKNTDYLRKLTEAQSKTESFATKTKSAFSGLGSLAGLVSMGAIMYKIAEETKEAQAAQAQLGAVLASTGGVAGVTADAANELATKLSEITAIDDDLILGAENMLLTFTSIGKDIFPQATETALDLSVAFKQDLRASAVQVGKALQDPIKGVSALSRVGVQFSESQKAMIKQMVGVNDKAGAQKLILAELNKQVGGSAAAYATTFGGALDRIKNTLGNIAASIGNRITPGLVDLSDAFSTAATNGSAFSGAIEAIGDIGSWALTGLGKAILNINIGMAQLRSHWMQVKMLMSTGLDFGSIEEAELYLQKAIGVGPIFEEKIAWTRKVIAAYKDIGVAEKALVDWEDRVAQRRKNEAKPKAPLSKEGDDGGGKGKDKINDFWGVEEKGVKGAKYNFAMKIVEEATKAANAIGNLFNTINQNIINSLTKAQEEVNTMLDFAEEQALKAAGIGAQTALQKTNAEIKTLQSQIIKEKNLIKRKNLQTELLEKQKEQKSLKIKEDYETKRFIVDEIFRMRRNHMMKQNFENQKAMSISLAAIQMAMGIMGAWAGAFSTIPFPPAAAILAGVMTALIAATGAIEIAAISSQKFTPYETGSWDVPTTGPALLHGGEIVTPRPLADSIRAGDAFLGGSAGGDLVLNVDGRQFGKIVNFRRAKQAARIGARNFATSGVY